MLETEQEPIIQTRGLHFYYGEYPALKDINLNINRHQVTALIGPSGCGKSTFLRTLNRMNDLIAESKAEGEVTIGGQNIYEPGTDVVELRKRIGMVFQQPNPFPMSIYDNIAFGPRLQGKKSRQELDRIVEESLIQAALWEEVKDDLHKSATGLSGGQQQRRVVARVLAVKPDIILMDEPTSALDPISTARLEQLIARLKEKYTIIMVTHNMEQAARVSDETVFFLHGEVVEHQTTEQLFDKPEKKVTEDYIFGRFG